MLLNTRNGRSHFRKLSRRSNRIMKRRKKMDLRKKIKKYKSKSIRGKTLTIGDFNSARRKLKQLKGLSSQTKRQERKQTRKTRRQTRKTRRQKRRQR